jgi:CBS domain-containing protein
MKVHGIQAAQVMTPDVTTAREDTSLADLVGVFDRFNVSCVPIVAADRLAGVVYRSDLLRPLAALKPRRTDTVASDAHVRAELDKLLEATRAIVSPVGASITFEVDGGIVRMTGVVRSEAERDALRAAVTAVAGVRVVQDELAVLPADISAI